MKKQFTHFLTAIILVLLCNMAMVYQANAQTFIHPGGLHTQADLDRMKTQVAAGAHPCIDDWNKLITDAQAQNTYTAAPQANMGVNRQRASADAHAAYLNTIRWYISGDSSFADCAIRICNAWSSAVNQVPTGNNIPGLSGIPISEFAMVGELLRISNRWAAADFTRFKNMMLTYWYPVCHDFLVNHNGACISSYWANWDICNTSALISIGVLCDDTAKYNEGVNYFKNGAGMGSIMNAVYYMHPGNLGQWQESNRDQEHAQLGVGMLAALCQVAWNQGLDLYGYSSNRLLAGAEYVAKYNLWQSVPNVPYNNCQNANQKWVSINGRGRLDDRPIWELIYNHYVVLQGLSAPNVTAMAQLMRPEHGSADHFGYGTLTFTLNAASSPYPPSPVVPPVPAGLTATAGVGNVYLKWTSSGTIATGYNVLRSTTSGGPYTSIAAWTASTASEYTDATAINGTTYYYVVSANNQTGTSGNSSQAGAMPQATGSLPIGWTQQDIGSVSAAGSAAYANVNGGTFVVNGYGSGIGGTADGLSYAYMNIAGNATITARISAISGSLSKTGIMIRESLSANATTLVMKLGDVGWREAGFGTRATTGGTMTWVGGNDYTWLPAWFRLQRVGNTFTAYESSDSITWFTVGSSTVTMANSYYIGLSVCSGGTSLNTTTFDNVTLVTTTFNGTYKLTNRSSGKCLDNLGVTTDGSTVAQWTSGSSTNQQWVITYSNGYYKLSCVTGGEYLDDLGHTTDGSTVGQWSNSTSTNQQWTITPVGGGYYKVINLANGKCLDTGGGTTNGSVMQFWYNGGSYNQQWTFTRLSGNYGMNAVPVAVTTVIKPEEQSFNITFYPNPVTNELIISNCLKDTKAELYDISGKLVWYKKVESDKVSINMSGVPSGIYIVKVDDGQNVVSKKIVKK